MSGHGSSGRWHFPVNSLWSRCSHVHHLVRQPVSLVAASVFPCRLGKFCFRQCAFLLRTQRSFNHCFQFRRHLLQRLFRGFGQKSGLRRLMPRQFFPGRKRRFYSFRFRAGMMPPLPEAPLEKGDAVFYLRLQNSRKVKAVFWAVRHLLKSIWNISIYFVIRTSLKLVHRRGPW